MGAPMFIAERRHAIVEMVRSSGVMSLRQIAEAVDSSEVTVRRDLRALEADGLLDRRRGGAAMPGALSHEASYSQKSRVASRAKLAIARHAAMLVEHDDAVVLGAGTTTQELARRLTRKRELTVVTNSLLVATELAAARAEVVLTGGILRGSTFALVGTGAEQGLAGLRVRLAFISGNGLTPERGLSTPNIAVAAVDRAIARSAQEVIVLADHTKLGIDTMVQTVAPDAITRVVTDEGADPAHVEALRASGLVVDVAPYEPHPLETPESALGQERA